MFVVDATPSLATVIPTKQGTLTSWAKSKPAMQAGPALCLDVVKATQKAAEASGCFMSLMQFSDNEEEPSVRKTVNEQSGFAGLLDLDCDDDVDTMDAATESNMSETQALELLLVLQREQQALSSPCIPYHPMLPERGRAPTRPAAPAVHTPVQALTAAQQSTTAQAAFEPDRELPAFDAETVHSWMFPSNLDERLYQRAIAEKALFKNTLVVLPTGELIFVSTDWAMFTT